MRKKKNKNSNYSFRYSVMTSDERQKAMEVFQKQWSVFLTKVISENRNT